MSDSKTVFSGVFSCAQALSQKQLSAVELAQHYLSRIEHDAHGAFLATNPEMTLAQAQKADERRAKGDTSPLLGVPIAHKDIFVTADFVTTAGSRILADYRSPFDATVVQKMAQAGMVTLGKLNCDEFAMGSGNENSAYQKVHNPWNKAHVPGGSSGGSSAAVIAGLTPAATGTDTGGSIRQPAAFCGITGIKPTYGRCSRYGMIAYASSLDQAGPMAPSALDCAYLLAAMAGPDIEKDATSVPKEVPDWVGLIQKTQASKPLQGLRIGMPSAFFSKKSEHVEVLPVIEKALALYENLGACCVPVELPHVDLAIATYYIIASAEASSNLSRFDGVKFGYRAPEYVDLYDMYVKTRSQGFGEEVKRRILMGTYVLSHGYYDAYYRKAQKIRRLIAQDFLQAFEQCDVIAAPVAPTVAWKLGGHASDPIADYLADIFTLPASLAGLPAMSHPCGEMKGLPVGLQLMGPYWNETILLQTAHAFQQASDWHQRRPGDCV